jgi:hypothetical protein
MLTNFLSAAKYMTGRKKAAANRTVSRKQDGSILKMYDSKYDDRHDCILIK